MITSGRVRKFAWLPRRVKVARRYHSQSLNMFVILCDSKRWIWLRSYCLAVEDVMCFAAGESFIIEECYENR